MTPSLESNIRNRVNERIAGKPRMVGLGGRRWALVGAAVVLAMVIGLLTMRQQSVAAAAAAIARAETKLDGIASYYVKYKDTQFGFGGMQVTYSELWHQSPDKVKIDLHTVSPASESGSGRRDIVRIVNGSSQWTYMGGSDAVYQSPVSDAARHDIPMRIETPRDRLRSLGKGYRYAGVQKVRGRECDVIELTIGSIHAKACIDRETGFVLQSVAMENGELRARQDAVDLQVNKPIPAEVFTPQLTPGATVVRVPSTPGPDGFPPLPILNTDPDAAGLASQLRDPDEAAVELLRLGKEGERNGAGLKSLYAPSHVPEGFMLANVGQVPEQVKTPLGRAGRSVSGAYRTVYIEYIDPDTGRAAVLTESSAEPRTSEGREVISNGFEGRIVTHREPFPYIDLFWKTNRVYFTLSASSMDEQEAVALARSMRQVFPQP